MGSRTVRFPFRHASLVIVISACVSAALAARAPQEPQHDVDHPPAAPHGHTAAAKLKNPVPANATSVAAGHALYVKNCAVCHGETGKGDGKMGEEMIPKPADLTDANWKHGSSDGEIFTLIRNGAKGTGMKAYSRKLTTHEIWDAVNYIRSIGPAKGD
jgi:mono/diheme cytochrome c family protein